MNILEEAAKLAASYNWQPKYFYPEHNILYGKVPEGFGTEVGKTIALFLQTFPFGKTKAEDIADRIHAKELGRLRLLVSRINRMNLEEKAKLCPKKELL